MPSNNSHGNRGWKRIGEVLAESDLVSHSPELPPPAPVLAPLTDSPVRRTAYDVRPCPHCGAEQRTVPMYVPMYDRTDYWWDTCPCRLATWAEDEQRVDAIIQRFSDRQKEEQVNAAGLRRIAHLTVDTFEPCWIQSDTPDAHPYAVATAWLRRILPAEQGDYRNAHVPSAALYFYSPGKGRGKTHLAAAIANAALAAGKRVAFTEEHAYLNDCWGKPFDERHAFLSWLGDYVWLSVLDDMGQRAKTNAAVADAWYELVNRRWMQARWTIITSNKTPDELLAQGTINEATYSRLAQMTNQQIILFQGTDQRLR